MAISMKDFDERHGVPRSGLPERISKVLESSEEALTATEVAADLLGIKNRYVRILSPEIQEVLPVVTQILDAGVEAGELRSLKVAHKLLGPTLHYARAQRDKTASA